MLTIKIFTYRFIQFLWNQQASTFEPIRFNCNVSFKDLLSKVNDDANTGDKRDFWRMMYGPGEIIVPAANPLLLLIDELMNPFYMFTIFSLGIWYWEAYTTFAIVLSVLAGVSILSSVWDTWSANWRVRQLAKYTCDVEQRQSDGSFKTVNSRELLPGDVIRVPTGVPLPVDLILLFGISIANEALLTGESIPVIKEQIKDSQETYDDTKSKNTLYAGTTVIQNKKVDDHEAWGLVKCTGFQTQKGSLVKDILYPKPFVFQFMRDVYKFIFLLGGIAMIGFFGVFPGLLNTIESGVEVFQKLADSLTIAVPPSLPASMNFGVVFALARLRLKKIYCIQSQRIPVAARI